MQAGNRRAILAALFANAGIAVAKFVAWLATGSASMLAEGVHSVADTSNQALLLLGGARAQRAEDADHPFGYGAARYFWSFVVALVLFLLGGLFALYEGFEKLRHPHELTNAAWAIGVLVVAIALETFSFRTAIVEANAVRGSAGWWDFIRHSKTPELPVVLLEDAGALFGLVLALCGVGLALATGNPVFDALGTLAIGALLCAISVVLSIEMKSLLIGEGASPADLAAIERAFATSPGVARVIHLRTRHLGPDEILVGAKLEFDRTFDLPRLAQAIDAAEEAVRRAVPRVGPIYVEPDLHDPAHRSRAERAAESLPHAASAH